MIKIIGKMDKSNTYNGFSGNISFFINIISRTRGVMVIVIGNGHGDTSSNPGRD